MENARASKKEVDEDRESPPKEQSDSDSLPEHSNEDCMVHRENDVESSTSKDDRVILQKHTEDETEGSRDPSETHAAEEPPAQNASRLKFAIGLFLLAFVAFVVVDTSTKGYVKDGTTDLLEWIEDNPAAGVVVFTVVIFFTTMLFIPGIILTFGSGYVFANGFGLGLGVALGSIAVIVGACSGAMTSFLLGRFLLRRCVTRLIQRFKLLQAIDSAMEEKGLTIMVLLRLSPVIFVSPYLNYGSGGLSVSFRDYALSLIATFPSAVLFVFLGASAGSLADSSGGGDSTTTLIVTIVGIVFSILAIGITTYYARQELRKITEHQTDEESDEVPVEEVETDIEEGRETPAVNDL